MIFQIEQTEPDMMQRHYREFCIELIARDFSLARDRFKNWSAIEAAQIILAAIARQDSPVSLKLIEEFAESMGALEDYWPEGQQNPAV